MQPADPFLEEVLYITVTSSYKNGFLQYVSNQERQVFLCGQEKYGSAEIEALLEILDAHECYKLPTQDNLVQFLSQVGHKCLIPALQYIHKCWCPIVHAITDTLPIGGLYQLLGGKNKTSKKVMHVLQFPEEMTTAQPCSCPVPEAIHY